MKQLSKQKWFLSTLLFAALGSQYYFSVTSKNSGLIEMSLLSTGQEQSLIDITAALQKTTPAATTPVAAVVPASGDKAPVVVASASAPVQKVEAVNAAAPCADCVTLTKTEAERIRQILVEVRDQKIAAKAAEEAETPSEKRERLREELKEKKRDAILAKAEKKQEEQDKRDDKFRSDFDKFSESCSDVACYSSKFAKALNRYSYKNKMISPHVVNEIFAEHVAKDLKEGLLDPENLKAQAALQTLMAHVPSVYKSIKNKSIDLAKAVTAPKAIEANASFKQGNLLAKTNINESNAAYARAREQKAELERMLSSQQTAILEGTEQVDDKSTLNYYNSSYAKPARQWLADIMNSSNFSTDTNSATGTANTNTSAPTRGVVRGGNGNTATGIQINNNDGKITTPNTNNFLNNVNFGTPQQGGPQGARGGRTSY